MYQVEKKNQVGSFKLKKPEKFKLDKIKKDAAILGLSKIWEFQVEVFKLKRSS